MKKFLFGFAALAVLATTSCKKDDEASGPSNKIMIAGETFAVSTFQTIGPIVMVGGGTTTTTTSSISFQFGTGTATPSSGTYKVVETADAADEVQLSVARYNSGNTTAYLSENASVNVTVGKDGDKMTITLPEVSVKKVGGTETIKVSASAKQL